MSDTPPSGFLQRWSRRKIEARQEPARPADDPAAADAPPDADTAQTAPAPADKVSAPAAPDAVRAPAGDTAAPALPTLDDVRALTAESDYSAFVAREVSPEVKNAALKKLFTDPHYNVMDGLDIYIDDYSQQAPLPESMLRKMAVSKVFGFFEDEARCAAGAVLDEPAADPVAPAGESLAAPDDAMHQAAIGTPVAAADERPTPAGTDPQDCDPAVAEAAARKHKH